jgi:hypothetical protein
MSEYEKARDRWGEREEREEREERKRGEAATPDSGCRR